MSAYYAGFIDGKIGLPYEPGDLKGEPETRYADGFAASRDFRDTHQTVKHSHFAGTAVGKHIDECAICGQDLRCAIHSTASATLKPQGVE